MGTAGGGGTVVHRLVPQWRRASFVCHVCWEASAGGAATLHCTGCQLDAHVACCATSPGATSPPDVAHVAHPHALRAAPCRPDRACDGCGATSSPPDDDARLVFHSCSPCSFDLCGLCARSPPLLRHPRHPHPLFLRKNKRPCTACNGCGEALQSNQLMYRCSSCDFDLHLTCVRLPQQVEHPYHPGHALSLRTHSTSRRCRCCVCGDSTSSTWAYACEACRLYMHPKCSGMEHRGAIIDLLLPTLPQQQQLEDPYMMSLLSQAQYHNNRHFQLPSILERIQLPPGSADVDTVNTLSLIHALTQSLPPSLSARDAEAVERVIALLRIAGS